MMNQDLKDIIDYRKKKGAESQFLKWHLIMKYKVIQQLLQDYLFPGCKFLDVACGDGDCLKVAKACQPKSEVWGIDVDLKSLAIAKNRIPDAKLIVGNMFNMEFLPEGYFDVLHEYGAAILVRDWEKVIQQYLRLVSDSGIILWELPQKWSMGHLVFLFSAAPTLTEGDTKIKRIYRSFSFSKYTFLSDRKIKKYLQASAYRFEVVEHVPIWYFYCQGGLRSLLDSLHFICGDRLFVIVDRLTGRIWPRYSGFYLVLKKNLK